MREEIVEMKTTKIIAAILALCIFISFMPQMAFAADEGGSKQEVSDNTEQSSKESAEQDGAQAPEETETSLAPGKPALKLVKKTYDRISFKWAKCKNATGYEVFYATIDKEGKYKSLAVLDAKTTKYSHEGLSPSKKYYYYVESINEGADEQAEPARTASKKYNWTTPKATTNIEGAIKTKSIKARKTLKDKITIVAPLNRSLKLQMADKGKWKTVKTIKLKNTINDQTLTVKYPNAWWKNSTTTYRYIIAASTKATKYTSKNIKITTKKYYQNPKKYLQLRNKISKHGHNYYTAPVLTNNASTRKDHVEAMIRTAKKYLGDPYVVCRSRAPGKGVDCSGLVMQACYGAGADLWPSNPYRHRFPKYEYESRRIARNSKLKTVSWKHRKRGDLIFYSKGGIVIHIAIYLGNGKIIHSWPGHVRISSATNPRWGYISKVKRVFQ